MYWPMRSRRPVRAQYIHSCTVVTELALEDLDAHQKTVFSSTSSAFLCSSAAYTCALLAALLFGSNRWLWPPLLLLPTFLAYTMHFRVKNTSQNDFQDRIWHSERMRGLRAGDEGGTAADERTKESAEWLNSVLRGVWPIVNPDMYVVSSSLLKSLPPPSPL